MTTNQEAKNKVDAAIHACAKVQAKWIAADKALGGSVTTNGYGIYSDRFELRNKLELSRQHITEALKAMDEIDWPTNDEYDRL